MSQYLRQLVAVCLWWSVGAASAGTTVDFNRDIRPILSENCYLCHGPDANHRKGELRLDMRESAIKAGAIVPGKPTESKLLARIHSADADEQMPPPDSGKKLTGPQRQALQAWIAEGAVYQKHWSFEPPVKPTIPAGQNGIDVLVGRHLRQHEITGAPPADRRTLARRLSFDLTGLPPKPEDVDAFSADQRPDADAHLVEKLLASPHFGERMAIGWLDVVRFADTIGYHSDNPRNVWPYRDWVIKSFNDNKRFDRFTIEQIAGDLLQDADRDTRVGSAFNRLLLTTEEGGAQPKDYEARMLTDRVRAVGAVWLGLTIGCCQCHDHKFDPLTMQDFYSLGAFFADIKEPIIGRREDGMLVIDPTQETKLKQLDHDVDIANKILADLQPKIEVALQQWEADLKTHAVTLEELKPKSKANAAEKKQAQQVADALKKEAGQRSPAETIVVRNYFLQKGTPLFKAERDNVAAAEKNRKDYFDTLPKCLVSESTTPKRTVRILPRGNWMVETGAIMKPALPTAFAPATAADRELTRLDLARWLVAADNPLTARTVMNRLWKQFFGISLSKVVDDLGAQGETPKQRELLDWLAREFVDSGWDVKHMVRQMVLSKTYQQASVTDDWALLVDPENRELARQSRYRLDAELVRDAALAISGLLAPTIGGPSVKPYQPDGYWDNLNFPQRKYQPDAGPSQYRRGLYTWWQRSFVHPSMLAFDAPTREECAADRGRSNIPQQALVLLNDPTYVEAARQFASRMLQAEPTDVDRRLTWAYRQAVQRSPNDQERATLKTLLDKQRAHGRRAPQAQEVLTVGQAPAPKVDPIELTAHTHLARVILNLHETITRD